MGTWRLAFCVMEEGFALRGETLPPKKAHATRPQGPRRFPKGDRKSLWSPPQGRNTPAEKSARNAPAGAPEGFQSSHVSETEKQGNSAAFPMRIIVLNLPCALKLSTLLWHPGQARGGRTMVSAAHASGVRGLPRRQPKRRPGRQRQQQ
jgi:hypothetical protein